jgi:hypothetical protein
VSFCTGVKMAQEKEHIMNPDYPVMFTVRDAISGNGFLAAVTLSGWALMVREDDDKWWVYGVRPSAIAESGSTPEEAFHRFRDAYKNVLFDAAKEAIQYEDFEKEIQRFYYEPEKSQEDRWVAAFQAIRAGQVIPEPPFFSQLPREAPETRPTQITVERLDASSTRYTPVDNVLDYFALPTAA